MKQKIKSTSFFEVEVDTSINRLYIKCIGFWQESTVADFLVTQKEALKLVRPNFTVVADMREYKTLSQKLIDKQKASQVELAQAGMSKAAEIIPGSIIAKLQLDKVTTETHMPSRQFATPEEGERWLNSMV